MLLMMILLASAAAMDYETFYVDVPIDHYSFSGGDTFKMRYFMNDTHWDREKGPVFLMMGGEDPIEGQLGNGLPLYLAERMEGLVIIAEHRYYGKSLPFGNASLEIENIKYLTASQAMADFIELLYVLLKDKPAANRNPVIALGGSYSGMLATYARIKYPFAITGAIASSAPVLMYSGLTNCNNYFKIITSAFIKASPSCATNIRKSWPVLRKLMEKPLGMEWFSTSFKLCEPITDDQENVFNKLYMWIENIFINTATSNYPYETSVIHPLPANPVQAMCSHLSEPSLNGKALLKGIFSAISVFTNYTGTTKCHRFEIKGTGKSNAAWDFQSCAQLVFPKCSNGINDMFESCPWNAEEFQRHCLERWDRMPNYDLGVRRFGGNNLRYASNIIFSNGMLDPWSGGGVPNNVSDTVLAVMIPGGAHCSDLRTPSDEEPPSLGWVRRLYEANVKRWIDEYWMMGSYVL